MPNEIKMNKRYNYITGYAESVMRFTCYKCGYAFIQEIGEYQVNVSADKKDTLITCCPNCHSMIKAVLYD